jgi:hypothetical protein
MFQKSALAFAFSTLMLVALESMPPAPRQVSSTPDVQWQLIWSDEFNGSGAVSSSDWIYDIGTGYGCAGCPPNWGTGEVETMSSSANNVFQSGGNLNIRALHADSNPTSGWTSGRIETTRTDFQAPAGGMMAVEARIQQPNVNTTNGLGIIYLKNSNSTGFSDLSFVFGNAGDKLVAGDWNADGIDTVGIYRNGLFYLTNSNTTGFADIVFALGNSGDFPISGTWNGSP